MSDGRRNPKSPSVSVRAGRGSEPVIRADGDVRGQTRGDGSGFVRMR